VLTWSKHVLYFNHISHKHFKPYENLLKSKLFFEISFFWSLYCCPLPVLQIVHIYKAWQPKQCKRKKTQIQKCMFALSFTQLLILGILVSSLVTDLSHSIVSSLCIYIYICVFASFIHVYMCMWLYNCMYVYVRVFTYIQEIAKWKRTMRVIRLASLHWCTISLVLPGIFIYVHIYTYTCTYIQTYMYIHIYVYICMCIYMYIYIYINI